MKKTLLLSGWLQAAESLQKLAPDAQMLDYSAYADGESALQAISEIRPDCVIGWSLGGILALHAMQEAQYRPEKIILIGTPYQFMASPEMPSGCSAELFAQIRREYISNPKHYARRFQRLLVHDAEDESKKCLLHPDAEDAGKWLHWMDYLADSSFHGWSAPYQPEVRIIHGMKDAVIPVAQAKYWNRIFPQVQVMVLPEMAHALTRDAAQMIMAEYESCGAK